MDALTLQPRVEEVFKHVDKDLDKHLKDAQKGCCFTGFSENKIIGCAGIMPLWNGVGHAWVVMGSDYKNNRIWLHRHIKNMFIKIAIGKEFKRVQANVQAGFKEGVRWIEALGFHRESKLEKYGPAGEDHYMYVRFFE